MNQHELHEFLNTSTPHSRRGRMKLTDEYSQTLNQIFIPGISIPRPISLHEFTNLTKLIKKAETVTEIQTKINGQLVTAPVTPTLNKNPADRNSISKEASAILKEIEEDAGLEFIQMFLDAYMAPHGQTDIKYRLGHVTSIKTNPQSNLLTGLPKPLWSPQTSVAGSIYTRANMSTLFKTKVWHKNKSVNYDVTYVNLFFPPYTNLLQSSPQSTLFDLKQVYGDVESPYYVEDEATRKAIQTWDNNFGLILRPDFTYREPAFKAITDNINLLQYLFEQTTGIVSTYLTEWDLSVYMQEGLLNQGSGPINLIYLLHRITKDNPMRWDDRRALNFGVVNAATSKLFGHLYERWDPGLYPSSQYHAMYELHRSHPSDPERDYPWFYDAAVLNDYNSLKFAVPNNYSVYINDLQRRIELIDYKQAALSGWSEWAIPFWKVFYTTAEDGLSPFDVQLMGMEMEGGPANELMADMADTVVAAGGTGSGMKNGGAATQTFDLVTPFGAFDFEKGIPKMKKKASSGSSSMQLAKKQADGYSPAEALKNSGEIGDDTPQNKKTAPTTGIPQKNPVLYGGPHGAFLSPKTVQGYFQTTNMFLRDQPRISGNTYGGFTNTNPNAYNDTVDRMYYEGGPDDSVNYGKSDQCPAYGLNRFYRGETTYTFQPAYKWVETQTLFRGKMLYYNRPCSADFSHVRAPNGEPIVRWLNDLHFKWYWEWQYNVDPYHDPEWWGGSYYFYWNKWARRQFQYNPTTRRYDVYVGIYAPFRTGVYKIKSHTTYKRYVLANFSDIQWVITKFNKPEHNISSTVISYPSSWWNWWWNRQWARTAVIYSVTYTTAIKYRLHFPGPMSWQQYMGGWSNIHSRNEVDFIRQIFGCSKMNQSGVTAGHSVDLIFCEGSKQSWSDRSRNGPQSMFKIKASTKEFISTYMETHSAWRRSRCRRWLDVWYITRSTRVVYIDIDPNQLQWFSHGTNKEGWTNRNTIEGDMLTGCIPTGDQFKRDVAIWEGMFPSVSVRMTMPTPAGAPPVNADVSIMGWGILSNIPGVATDAVDSDWEKDAVYWLNYGNYYRRYKPSLSANAAHEEIFNTRFVDIPRPELRITHYDYAPRKDEWGNEYFFDNGIPTYSVVGELDEGLRKAITRLTTNSTFYPMNSSQYAYMVAIDAPIRMFLNQLSYQKGFLETIRDYLFCPQTGLSFEAIKNVLESCVDERTVSVSKKVYDSSGNILVKSDANPSIAYDPEDYKYNYYIDQACDFFEKDLAVEKRNMILNVNNRITLYQNAINVLSKPITKDNATEWTWNEIKDCFEQIFLIKNSISQSLILDNFLFMYLNILYEYRKYFVNKRWNKSDGTMWIMRHLEAIMPMFSERSTLKDMPTLSEISKTQNCYSVSYYDVQNSLEKKVEVFQKSTTSDKKLEPDRIIRVYVQVDYVSERDYDLDRGQGNIVKVYRPTYWTEKIKNEEGKIEKVLMQPLTVKHNKFIGYARKPIDGHYYLESRERLTYDNNKKFNETVSPNEPKRLKFLRDDIDFAHWNITWGDKLGKTPIFFNMFEGIDTDKMQKLNYINGPSGDIMIDVCNFKKTGDFWTVTIPTNVWPRAVGYLNDVMLIPYHADAEITTEEEELQRVVAGAFAYQLYPITEQQARLIPSEPGLELMAELKNKTLSTTISKPDSY